jgi:hypothetical protein
MMKSKYRENHRVDRRVSALVAREVTVARDPIEIDRNTLRAEIRKR